MDIQSSRNHCVAQPLAPGIAYLTIAFVNTYFVGEPGGPWALVDTGLPFSAGYLRHAVEQWHGSDARPNAIILTHGHFDHAGSALELASHWNVPVYAHALEMPYLTGRSDYPPQDPTIGGAIAFESRFFPHNGYDLGDSVQPLPEDGSVPGMPGWRWVHTPGHTAGHVSLFRDSDRALLAGDAFTTIDMDSWSAQLTERRELDRPPAPLTTDWTAARQSIQRLADLRPAVVAAGHGIPMASPNLSAGLHGLAARLAPPDGGRYALLPAYSDERGIVSLPPPVHDPLPRQLAVAAALTLVAVIILHRRRQNS